MATDLHSGFVVGLDSTHSNGVAVTPSDSVDLEYVTRALWIGTTGNVKVTMINGETLTLANVPDGRELRIRVTRVWSTDTTAGSIVALW